MCVCPPVEAYAEARTRRWTALWIDLPAAGPVAQHGDRPGAARAGRRRASAWLRLYALGARLPLVRPARAGRPALRRASGSRRSASTSVRRPTGGRAVWHAGELTYAVAAPADGLGALREAYRRDPRDAARRAPRARRRRPSWRRPGGRDAVGRRRLLRRARGRRVMVAGARWWAAPSSGRAAPCCSTAAILLDGRPGTVVGAVTRGAAAARPVGARWPALLGDRPGRRPSRTRSRRRRRRAGRGRLDAASPAIRDRGRRGAASRPGSARPAGPGRHERAADVAVPALQCYILLSPPPHRQTRSLRDALRRSRLLVLARARPRRAAPASRSGRPQRASSSSPASEATMPIPTLMEGPQSQPWPTSTSPTSSSSGWPSSGPTLITAGDRASSPCWRGAGPGATR